MYKKILKNTSYKENVKAKISTKFKIRPHIYSN